MKKGLFLLVALSGCSFSAEIGRGQPGFAEFKTAVEQAFNARGQILQQMDDRLKKLEPKSEETK